VYQGSLLEVTVDGNAASAFGGGVALYNQSVLRDSAVVANTADYWGGGGLLVYGDNRDARATVDTCSVTDNVAKNGGSGAYVEWQEFESIDTDWGKLRRLSFSLPDDDGDYFFYGGFGASADFVCDLTSDDCG
jgi:hypothetical protein